MRRVLPGGGHRFPVPRLREWYDSDTRAGTMVHARLGAGAENSGKLVSIVRREARRIAEEEGATRVLVDGPPGVGCPVIASVTGASSVLVVTEPTPSGEHDLERILSLAAHFGIPASVLINKWDLNPGMTERIETAATARGASLVGRIRYDHVVTRSQMAAQAVVEGPASAVTREIEAAWERLLAETPATPPAIPLRFT